MRIRATARRIGSFWLPSRNRSSEHGWGQTTGQVIADLEDLNCATERDFLAVGAKLMGFRSTARRIETEMSALTELIAGEQGGHASHALTGILQHSKGMDEQIEQSGKTLAEVRDLSCRIRHAFSGLGNTVSVFRTLCTLTRIETSRLGSSGADFGDLADEVRPLSESIQVSGDGVLETSAQLDQRIQSSIHSAAELRARQLQELPALIAGVVESLSSFQERRQRAADSSMRQAAQYRELCESIDDVVHSVQFHDITRQQVEHVVQAIRQVHSGGATGHRNLTSLPKEGSAILALQSSQLAGAADTFGTSIRRIENGLENMTVRAQEIAEGGRTLLGISADDHDSFFRQMETRFADILKMLSSCNTAQGEMQSTAANLEESITKMRDSIAEIGEIEIRIQRIATNASIRAAHLGDDGKALNVIAEVMQRLALESSTNTEDVSATLQAMSDAVGRIYRGSSQTLSDASSETNASAEEMGRMVVELHSSSECSFARANEIAALGALLAEDVGALRNGFSAGPLFAKVVTQARRELDRIAAKAGNSPLGSASDSAAPHLENLATNYTMQTERDVHVSVTGGAALPEPVMAAVEESMTDDGDLGANVELF